MSRDEKGTDIRVAKGKVNKIDLAKLDSRETYRLLHKGTLLEDHLSVERLGREAAAAGAYADQDTVVLTAVPMSGRHSAYAEPVSELAATA
jgi:hypothetical protein